MRTCAKLRCSAGASVTLALRYGDREVLVGALAPDTDPSLVDLCLEHADDLTPPIGWRIVDLRSASLPARREAHRARPTVGV